ncbi:MAG: hypothetical protein RIQ79_1161, partial [Verrucomicrobiota bacterium]
AFRLPKNYFLPDTPLVDDPASRSFQIELSEALAKPAASAKAEATPPKFVEVNPAAPENVPDMTPNVGAQNQQVAQPVESPETKSDAPKLDGKPDEATTAIVSGQLQEKSTPAAVDFQAVFTPPQPEPFIAEPSLKPAKPALESIPLPGSEELLGQADGSTGSTITTLPGKPSEKPGPRVEGKPNGQAGGEGYFAGTPRIARDRPQTRPSLATRAVNARPTETIFNDQGTKNVGAVSYNAKWDAYGEYIQRLIDAVQVQWERLIIRSPVYPTPGTSVKVTFKINAAGTISEIVKVESQQGEKTAEYLCISAITERAPYGEWSDDMIAALGKEQEMTFRFFYH